MKALIPYLKLFKHQWLMMCTGLLLSIVTLLTGIGLLSLSGWFLSASAVAGLSVTTAMMFNYFAPAAGVRFFSIARTASRYGERLATHEATFRLLTQLRSWVWCKIWPLSAKNLQGLRQGDLLNRLVADIDTLDHLYLRLITPMTAVLVVLGALYVFVSWFDAKLALTLCAMLLSVWLILPYVFYRLGHRSGIDQLEHKRQFRVLLLEFIQGQAEISLFGATQRFRERLTQAEIAMLSSQRAMASVTALSQAGMIVFHGLAVAVMFYMAASGVGDNVPPGPLLAMIVFMTMACIEMLMPISGAFQHLSGCIRAATRVNELVEQDSDICFNEASNIKLTSGSIELNQLVFSYDASAASQVADSIGNAVLNGLNLSIKPGEKVAILGQTGCGKSTLLSLITRQWQQDSGTISLGGVDIAAYSQAALSEGITLVSQRVYLFSGTLRANLTLAQPDVELLATRTERKQARLINDAVLLEVLNRVGLSVLTRGEKALDAWIGEGGRQLSGGEQRRIGVARALLRDAPILLLDEPTEGLDKRTEREILAILFEFAKDKTVLMISHRLTAMAQMDCIYLMEAGGIRASGTHISLLKHDRYYASLYHCI